MKGGRIYANRKETANGIAAGSPSAPPDGNSLRLPLPAGLAGRSGNDIGPMPVKGIEENSAKPDMEASPPAPSAAESSDILL
jgi:hypothetical protein